MTWGRTLPPAELLCKVSGSWLTRPPPPSSSQLLAWSGCSSRVPVPCLTLLFGPVLGGFWVMVVMMAERGQELRRCCPSRLTLQGGVATLTLVVCGSKSEKSGAAQALLGKGCCSQCSH